MTDIKLPYGKTYLSARIADNWHVTQVLPAEATPALDPIATVKTALDQPLGDANLGDFEGTESVAIAINDKTRPVPHDELLPPLLERLTELGFEDDQITFVIATGSHPVMPPSEYDLILPNDIIQRYKIVCHNATDKASLVHIGTTERGTPVWINRHFAQADLKIVVGNIEPHQFMGFSGGVKSAVIGVAGKETINQNHALMTHADSRLGHYVGNPAREDVEEMGRMLRIPFALNALLNGKKQIVAALAGAPVEVMQAAIPQVRRIFQVGVEAPFDVVIASPGGYPKDINVYQSQKALAHAALITREGGTVIIAAACTEGTGSDTYENWMLADDKPTPHSVIQRFEREGFKIGAHKAYQIARDAAKVRVLLISDMDADFSRKLLFDPIDSLQTALDQVLADAPSDIRIGVLPVANATIPNLKAPALG